MFCAVRADSEEKQTHKIEKGSCRVQYLRPVDGKRFDCSDGKDHQGREGCVENGRAVKLIWPLTGRMQQFVGRRARDGRDEDACRERRQEHQNEDQKRHADGGHE